MNIAIYQVNMGRDHNRVAFQSLDEMERFHGSSEIESEIYDKVFEGEVNCENLEDVYRKFNIDHPDGYKGRSLSVSDVVGVSAFLVQVAYKVKFLYIPVSSFSVSLSNSDT